MNDRSNLTPTSTDLSFEAIQTGSGKTWKVSGRAWGDYRNCRAAALLVHGLGAHSGWFESFAKRLAAAGFFAYSYDQVGFGSRINEKFISRQQWLDDILASYGELVRLVGNKPIYLVGNSMGAVVAINQAQRVKPEPSALLLFSPGFDGHPVTFNWPYKISALAKGVFFPEQQVELPYTVDDITPNEAVRDFLKNDRQRRFTLDARMGVELFKLTRSTQANVKSVPCPILMATAGVEKIVDNAISERMFDIIKAPVKKRIHLAHAWHDMMFEPFVGELSNQVIEWIGSLEPAARSQPASI